MVEMHVINPIQGPMSFSQDPTIFVDKLEFFDFSGHLEQTIISPSKQIEVDEMSI